MALIKCKECNEDISKKSKKCPKCGAPNKKRTSLFTWLVTIFILIIIISSFSEKTGKPSNKEIAMRNVKLDFSFRKAGFGNVMEVDFIITNNSNYQIKDIEIECNHFSKSNTEIDSNTRIIYDVFSPNSKKKINKFNMGFIHSQANKSSCKIVDLKI